MLLVLSYAKDIIKDRKIMEEIANIIYYINIFNQYDRYAFLHF